MRSQVIRVREEEHLPLLADFIRAVWSPGIQVEALRAARARAAESNPAQPGEAPPTFLFLIDGRAVGHLTTIPTLLEVEGQPIPAHWLKGFWVLPEHRNGPIGAMLVREATRRLDCLLATVVDQAPRRVFEAFEIRDRGCLSEHVKLLRPERVIRNLDLDRLGLALNGPTRAVLACAQWPGISLLAGGVARAAVALRSIGAGGASDVESKLASAATRREDLDALWRAVADGGPSGPVRDGAYLGRQYGLGRGEPGNDELHRVVTLVRRGRVVAWAAIRRAREGGGHPRLRGIRLAAITDFVVPLAQVADARALLRESEVVARADGADALLCSTSHAALRGWLDGRGFVRVGGQLHLAARDPRGGPALPKSIDDWWITRADGGADESL